jgi:plasmid stabilization system protein ParE
VAEDLYRVELIASFLERLDAIEVFLTEADAAFAFDDLLAELRATVVPNLARFPRIGRRYLDNPPQSAEALAQLAALPAGAASALREYLHGDYLMLYTAMDTNATVCLLSIRHHRQLSFDFAHLWPGANTPRQPSAESPCPTSIKS